MQNCLQSGSWFSGDRYYDMYPEILLGVVSLLVDTRGQNCYIYS